MKDLPLRLGLVRDERGGGVVIVVVVVGLVVGDVLLDDRLLDFFPVR